MRGVRRLGAPIVLQSKLQKFRDIIVPVTETTLPPIHVAAVSGTILFLINDN